ncbi:MAG: hypothetical protein HYY13_01730 [Nitrospirae bacterium]|nr:hypothetical protein [Nitrospirota bacterium]
MTSQAKTQSVARPRLDASLIWPIAGSHIKRIGFIRTALGGLPMYTCIPALILFHSTFTVALYQWLFRPLLGIQRLRWADYVVLDRFRYDMLPLLDRFNCQFCGYANGLCVMMNKELDTLAGFSGCLPLWKKLLLAPTGVIMLALWVVAEFSQRIIYDLMVSLPLGMHRVGFGEARRMLAGHGYGAGLGTVQGALLRLGKNTMLRFSLALEQIESSWCPLKHYETREGIVYPEHHKKFFGPDEIERIREVLSTEGTVSDRKPLY